MKKLFTLTVLIASTLISHAQHYTFSEDVEPYSDLVEATVIESPDFENDNFNFIDLAGETINLFGLDFNFGGNTSFLFQTFGNVRIDNDSSAIIIDAVFANLDPIDESTALSWAVEGESGSFIVKVQWKNVSVANGEAGNFANFQIWVHQASGIIECRYGPRSENNATGYTEDNGPYTGIFYAPDTFGFVYEKLWISGEPDNLQQSETPNFFLNRMLGIPADGAVLRFTPVGTSTGIDDEIVISNKISIYPNPAVNVLNVGLNDYKITGLRIISVTGEEIYRGSSLDSIDVSGINAGSYLLEIQTDSGLIYEKFIKK